MVRTLDRADDFETAVLLRERDKSRSHSSAAPVIAMSMDMAS
jgi:hypothetical protein